jgi:orotate phosphoribosyltransferase
VSRTTAPIPRLTVWRGDPDVIADLLSLPGALLEGHFRLLSGLHSDRFVAFSQITAKPGVPELLADWLLPSLGAMRPDAVLAPSTAGVGLGWAIAQRFGVPLHLATLDAPGRPEAVLGEQDLNGASILLVNDVVTTGDGLVALAELVRERGAEVGAATWFLSRSDVELSERIGAPSIALARLPLQTWHERECPLCAAGIEATEATDLN